MCPNLTYTTEVVHPYIFITHISLIIIMESWTIMNYYLAVYQHLVTALHTFFVSFELILPSAVHSHFVGFGVQKTVTNHSSASCTR